MLPKGNSAGWNTEIVPANHGDLKRGGSGEQQQSHNVREAGELFTMSIVLARRDPSKPTPSWDGDQQRSGVLRQKPWKRGGELGRAGAAVLRLSRTGLGWDCC